jgi:hypothetical protein
MNDAKESSEPIISLMAASAFILDRAEAFFCY